MASFRIQISCKYLPVLICYLAVFPFAGLANILDSLENKLLTTKDSRDKVQLLYTLANQYILQQGCSDKVKAYADRCYQLAQQLHDPLSIAYCHDLQGIIYRNTSNYKDALTAHKKALSISQQLVHETSVAHFLNNIGVVFRRIGDYQSAIQYHLQALKKAEMIKDTVNTSVAINSIGNIYLSMHEWGKALNYLNKGLELQTAHNNKLGVAINLNNIGSVYENLHDYDKALNYYLQSLEINTELQNSRGIAICYNDIGNIYKKTQHPDNALVYYLKALDINRKLGDKAYLIDNYINIGEVSCHLNNYTRSLHFLKKALENALQVGSKNQLQVCYETFSKVYTHMGEHEQALVHFEQAIAYKDSLLNEHNAKNIANLQALFDSEKKEARIEMLEHEKKDKEGKIKQQRAVAAVLILGLVLIVVLFTIVYKNNLMRKETNQVLACQNVAINQKKEEILQQKEKIDIKNRELTLLNEEKTHLIGIVAHDLRSPLNRIIGLANVMSLNAKNLTTEQQQYIKLIADETARLNDMTAKILDMNAIDSQRINLQLEKINTYSLLQKVIKNVEPVALKKQIAIHFTPATTSGYATLDWDYATQIIENLLSNAIKFSPAGKNIYVHLYTSEQTVSISIKDEGPGFSREDKQKLFGKFQKLSARPTAGEASTGLGLSIVKKYVEAMDGRISCRSESGDGAEFILTFKKADIADMKESQLL